MHLRRHHSRTRAALGQAREIYRRTSGAQTAPAKTPPSTDLARPAAEEAPRPKAPSRSAALMRQAASRVRSRTRTDPDVYLNVPRLHVDRVDLKVDELAARVALQAHVLDLLRLDVGVDANLRGVSLEIDGVDAQAQLEVRLENLTTIVDRVMKTIDNNPQLLENLLQRLGDSVNELGSTAARTIRPGHEQPAPPLPPSAPPGPAAP